MVTTVVRVVTFIVFLVVVVYRFYERYEFVTVEFAISVDIGFIENDFQLSRFFIINFFSRIVSSQEFFEGDSVAVIHVEHAESVLWRDAVVFHNVH